MELVKANPLPQVVRVLIGYCDEMDEDDTKEQDDIITIEGVHKGRNDEVIIRDLRHSMGVHSCPDSTNNDNDDNTNHDSYNIYNK